MRPTKHVTPILVGILCASLGVAAVRAAPPPAARGRTPVARQTDANITKLATNLLGRSQFAHHPLDTELAAKFLDRYLDALDGTHSVFLQTDVTELAGGFRATLAKATLAEGDTSAAHALYARYLERMRQQVAFVSSFLRAAKLEFTGKDVYSYDRKHVPRPADLEAAHQLWKQQIRAEYLQEKLADKPAATLTSTLIRRHEQQLKMMEGLHDDEILEVYLDALAHVYDPHSDYLGHEQLESFSITMKLSLFGIGAALEIDDGYCTIRELLPGGPAARSGQLKPGDRIVAVAQSGKEPVDILNMPLSRAVELIRGPRGSKVTLTILQGTGADSAAPKTVSMIRDEIKLEDQQAKARVLDVPTAKGPPLRLGMIDLPSFYADMGPDRGGARARRSATADVARLLKKLKAENVRGLVMDLRRNGGGSLDEAISLTGLFIRKGPVVQTRDQSGKIEIGADEDPGVQWDGPLVLLTSRFSASATEILAGAIQDYGRGVIVGDSSTFGKGTVQTLLMLGPLMDEAGLTHSYDPGALKVTISKFYRPNGASTQLRGVASDIVLPSATDFADVSESSQDDPLPWDSVAGAPHERLDRVTPFLGTLREASRKRVATNKSFTYLRDEVERMSKSLDAKVVSLNEADRRREQAEAKVRLKQERLARASDPMRPTVYELTLGNVDKPGLPAPLPPPTAASAVGSAGGAAGSASAAKPGAKDKPAAKDKDKAAAKDDAGEKDKDDDERKAGSDLLLDESVRILADYVGLTGAHAP